MIFLFRPLKSFSRQYLILGCYSQKDRVYVNLKNRLDTFLLIGSLDQVVVSGGQGIDEDDSEANIMCRYLHANGILNIVLENESTSTYENFLFSKKLLDEDVVIISNQFHMFRCFLISKRLGVKIKYHYCSNSTNIKGLFMEPFAVVKTIIYDLR